MNYVSDTLNMKFAAIFIALASLTCIYKSLEQTTGYQNLYARYSMIASYIGVEQWIKNNNNAF